MAAPLCVARAWRRLAPPKGAHELVQGLGQLPAVTGNLRAAVAGEAGVACRGAHGGYERAVAELRADCLRDVLLRRGAVPAYARPARRAADAPPGVVPVPTLETPSARQQREVSVPGIRPVPTRERGYVPPDSTAQFIAGYTPRDYADE